jgi:hypothetical protein
VHAQDVTALLDESAEWEAEWAEKVFGVITQFGDEYASACISEKSTSTQGNVDK